MTDKPIDKVNEILFQMNKKMDAMLLRVINIQTEIYYIKNEIDKIPERKDGWFNSYWVKKPP